MDDLLERIQASKEELEAHLQNVHACKIDGKLIGLFFLKRKNKMSEK